MKATTLTSAPKASESARFHDFAILPYGRVQCTRFSRRVGTRVFRQRRHSAFFRSGADALWPEARIAVGGDKREWAGGYCDFSARNPLLTGPGTITSILLLTAQALQSLLPPAINPATNQPYVFAKDGLKRLVASLPPISSARKLDPPAHWAPEYPAIDEIPATFAVRPLVVISIVEQLKKDDNYHLRVADIENWEAEHGRIPEGSVVFVRSDWSKRWPDPALATTKRFPGVSLAALKFLHEQRKILFHGHEPLDTDSTPTLEGEEWLMHHGYAQAEGVANLDQVPEKGALVSIGYPKFGGGTGGYARYIAICPADWKYGITISETKEAPMPKSDKPLKRDSSAGMRTR
jgi:kynurenine formamidase